MKKTNLILLSLLLATVFLSNSCATTTQNSSKTQGSVFDNAVEKAYPDRIEKTVIGMDFDDFKTIWPEATKVGIGDIYEFTYTHWTITGVLYAYKVHTKFYFSNDKLIKYESNRTYN